MGCNRGVVRFLFLFVFLLSSKAYSQIVSGNSETIDVENQYIVVLNSTGTNTSNNPQTADSSALSDLINQIMIDVESQKKLTRTGTVKKIVGN